MLEELNKVVEDELVNSEGKNSKMGAPRNMSSSRISVLQERKKQIEETLTKRNQELRQLCIQEAELTGITPPEMPLEPGETLPLIRRRIGTSYQLPEKLIKNSGNKDEIIADLELQIQVHANMAEAALGLANEHNMSKTMKRQHRSEYQKHKQQCLALQEKLADLKEKSATEQQKQKKKPRADSNSDDTISITTNGNESLVKPDPRHSMSSLKHPAHTDTVDFRHRQDTSRTYRISEVPYHSQQIQKPEDLLTSSFYRLSLNGYSKYMERRENINNMYTPQYAYSLSQMPAVSQHAHSQHSLSSYEQNSPISQHSSLIPQHSPHISHSSPYMSQQIPHLSHLSPHSSHYVHGPQKSQHSPQQRFSQFSQYSSEFVEINHRQPSPTASLSPKTHYYPSHPVLSRQTFRYDNDIILRNRHQIQPHQQYEQINVVTSGLGGYWKRMTNGELVWSSSSVIDGTWQRDKRFGSLDRRKTKRLTSRISPSMENKSATMSTVPNYQGQIRSASVKNAQILNRPSQDHGQLVRTQSLGSVGAITVDSVYPTDDSSSYGSDIRNIEMNQTLKKHKEKEWLETSLDGPISPPGPLSPHRLTPHNSGSVPPSHSSFASSPSIITTSPFTADEKPFKEIPAESNPSPKLREPNLELFNNNIPKNCTLVQAGQCKPYHEETKPFEMSDFYKYSTKFKKSPSKSESNIKPKPNSNISQKNLNERFEDDPKTSYSPFQAISNNSETSGNLENSLTLNSSLDLGDLAVSEHFSDEMNAWYKEQRKNNNNPGTNSKSRSTATLV